MTSLRRLRIAHDGQLDPVMGGQLLLMSAGLISSATAPLLQPDHAAWVAIGLVTAGMAVLLVATIAVPWTRLPRRSTLAFPAAVLTALIILSVTHPGFFAPLTGLITLCFTYIGLTQPRGTSLLILPFAVITSVIAYNGLTGPVAVRLFIGSCIWILLGELLAHSTTRQARLTAALRAAADTDVLTGVSNRRGLQLRLSLVQVGDVLVIADLDHFKQLNDAFGHEAGDRVLADFGAVARASLREVDYVARYGGEEFVLVLAATSAANARLVLQRLRENWAVLQPTVTFSAGIAMCGHDRSPSETLAAADRALYLAKDAGRNTDRTDEDQLTVASPAATPPANVSARVESRQG